jgi:glycosyltransferase involved in cell wall biosynthesis
MRILLWHVHGSYTTSFVGGEHEYLLPLLPDRGPDGRGRAASWNWPANAREIPADRLRHEQFDVVVLQRPHEADLVQRWTGCEVGRDVPAVYLEHNAPTGHAVSSRHPVLDDPRLRDVPLVHVTHFNALAWDSEDHPSRVVEHGIPDPGYLYTGTDPSLAVVVNEPVRRRRVAGSDLVLRLARDLPVRVYGMGSVELGACAEERGLAGLDRSRCRDLPQNQLHRELGRHRAYLHPYRWTSLGLSLIEAMTIGMPVLALSMTEAPEAVPAEAGVVTNDLDRLTVAAQRLLADPDAARRRGRAARAHALSRYSLPRFLKDWDRVLLEVTT